VTVGWESAGQSVERGAPGPWTLLVLFLAAALVPMACSGGDQGSADATVEDTLTRRQRDSIIGESPLPGAQGVQGALRAADSAAARMERLDSIGSDY